MAVEYASKGLANGLGIPALVTGGLALLNSANCGNGGLLGGLFGNNCNHARMGAELQYVSNLQAENAMLKAENYSDKGALEAYKQSVADNKELRAEMYAFIKPLADEAANNRVKIAQLEADQKCCCEKQALQAEITAGKINEATLALNGKIDTMQANYNGAFNSLNQTIACISNTVNSITKIAVDSCKLCPGVVYATQSVPATGTTWYPGCINPVAPSTTASTPAA